MLWDHSYLPTHLTPGMIAGIVFILVLIAGITVIFNSLIKRRNWVDAAWAQVMSQQQRRWDLVDDLVKTVRPYAGESGDVLDDVVQARDDAASAEMKGQLENAEYRLEAGLRDLAAIADGRLDLGSETNFPDLQAALSDADEAIDHARRSYNDTVGRYNRYVQKMPIAIFAAIFGYEQRRTFDVERGAGQAPEAKLLEGE